MQHDKISKVFKVAVILTLYLADSGVVKAQSVSGTWEADTKDGKLSMELKANGKLLTGTVAIGGGSFPIEDGKVVDSNTISLAWTTDFPPGGNPIRRSAVGKLTANEIKLDINGEILSRRDRFMETLTLKRRSGQ